MFVALTYGMLGGLVMALATLAVLETTGTFGLPFGRKRRLIEAGRLCECGHGSWEHYGDTAGCAHEGPVSSLCSCKRFTAREPGWAPPPQAKELKAPELYKRLMATTNRGD